MSKSATLTAPVRGEHAIDLNGRDLGIIKTRVAEYAYLDDGSRVPLYRLAHHVPTPVQKSVQTGVTLYEFPDGTCRAATLEEWLEA